MAQDKIYGMFINVVLSRVWDVCCSDLYDGDVVYDAQNDEIVQEAVEQYLGMSPAEGMKYWFFTCSTDELISIVNDEISLDDESKDDCDICELGTLLLRGISHVKRLNAMEDLGYKKLKKAYIMFHLHLNVIIECTMPDLYAQLTDTDSVQYNTIMLQCMRKIIDGTYIDNYQRNNDQPSKPVIQMAADQAIPWIKDEMIKSDKKTTKVTSRATQESHFPPLFGLLCPVLSFNHYPERVREYDDNSFKYGTALKIILTSFQIQLSSISLHKISTHKASINQLEWLFKKLQ